MASADQPLQELVDVFGSFASRMRTLSQDTAAFGSALRNGLIPN